MCLTLGISRALFSIVFAEATEVMVKIISYISNQVSLHMKFHTSSKLMIYWSIIFLRNPTQVAGASYSMIVWILAVALLLLVVGYICRMIIGQAALNTNTLISIIPIMILITLGGGEQGPAWQGLVDHLHRSLPSPCCSCYYTCLWMDTNTNLVDHVSQKLY